MFLSLAGLIGAGKSTLAKTLAENLKLPLHLENTQDDPMLDDFYRDRKTHAFALNIHLLNVRYRQQQSIYWEKRGAVQDRTIYEDGIFVEMLTAEGSITPTQRDIYKETFDLLSHNMTHPTLIIYLRVTPETALRRIQKRKRPAELQGIDLGYLRNLHAHYEREMRALAKRMPVLGIEWDEDDLDPIAVANQITAFLGEKDFMYHL